jgi:hypothetical protein
METCQAMNKPQETIAEFKHRIALLMRNREGGKQYSIIGAARPDPCVVRPKKPAKESESILGGAACEWINILWRVAEKLETNLANPKPHGIIEKEKE